MAEPAEGREVGEPTAAGGRVDRAAAVRLAAAAARHWRWLATGGALFPVAAVLELAQPWLVKIAIDDYILPGDLRGLEAVVGVCLVVHLALYGVRAAEGYALAVAGQRVLRDLRARLFGHVIELDAAFFDRQPVGRLMTRILNDPEGVGEAVTSGLLAVIGDTVTLVGLVVVMLWLDWQLALVTLSLLPGLALVAAAFRIAARRAWRASRRRLARFNGQLHESLTGLAVLQLLVRERWAAVELEALGRSYRRAAFKSTGWEASLYALVEAAGSVTLAALLWWGGAGVAAGTASLGVLVAFIQYATRMYLPIRDLGAKFAILQGALVSAERIHALLDVRPAIAAPPAPFAPGPRAAAAAAVEFVGVGFRYPGGPPVLEDCSFRVETGERVALIGATGEGKSTCARLMNRSYDVDAGAVLIDGRDVRTWHPARLRQHVGLVFQEPILFAGPLAESVDARGRGDVAAVARALEACGAGRLADRVVGREGIRLLARGANLSHGERQQVALARALVYDPRVLVLDEAMSSVDAAADASAQVGLERWRHGRTLVTVAHRLASLERADRILVLHRGRIRETGAHAELLAVGGLYARLWELAACEVAQPRADGG